MELREFVRQTLVDLVRGIEDAQTELSSSKAIINPLGTPNIIKLNENKDVTFGDVEFEIQLDVKKSKKGEGGVKISVLNTINAGAGRQNDSSHGETNKIRFSIPVHFPPGILVK